jgi:hypothetical protein
MMYMTPELLARFRSVDDDISEAAAEEWERRGMEYRGHLEQLGSRPDLPRGLRKLLKRDILHDAKVLTMAVDKGNCFSLFLELAGPVNPQDRHLELRYRLAGGPGSGLEFIEHPILKGDGKPFGWWMYDEFDVTAGKVEAYTHSILFTGGWEVQLRFFSLACRPLDFLWLPANGEGVIDPKEVARLLKLQRAFGAGSRSA